MPTYEFRCPQGHQFDKFYRTIGDAVLEVPCPECGETAARQITGGSGFLLKGSGFYLTDYGKNAHRKTGDAKPSSSESKGSESKGSESRSTESKGAESKPSGGSDAGATKPASGDKG